MRKRIIKLGVLLMTAVIMASPASYVRAAGGMEGTETGWEDVQEGETEVEDGMEISDDGGITTYGCSRGRYIVKINSAKARSGPGVSYSVIAILKQGKVVNVSSIDNGWAKFKYGDRIAYISETSLKKMNR